MSNIWVACADGNIAAVKTFLSNGGSPNAPDPNGYTPMHAAASYNNGELLALLVENGGDVNVQDSEGDTPLHHVEEVAMAKLLVEKYSADYKIKNGEGQTAAEYIDEDGEFPQVVTYLKSLIHGGIPQDDEEDTPKLPEGQQLRYELKNEEDITIDIDDDKRMKLKEIVEGENPEENLKEFLRNEVHQQFYSDGDQTASPASKKRKE
ncbi:CYFA0S05e00650g1_1 [Cyberlindnera fabianii]|uniref:Ankyrin-1 n=1 Tax=Cyberlindnera fabianii TaxID=36022 RepID=A0A061B0D6_CYBFA|nr:Ankyrin-1 [Cyberlindnera fabianii]CDR40450.1 CYFA0S05e00650g1_1 [Cyberlindnera fabianii]